MHPILFTRPASAELAGAQDWYEKEVLGLGRRFRQAIDTLVERISADPLHFPIVYKDIRRALLHRFPYALLFVVAPDEMPGETLLVIACFHSSRDPARWQRQPDPQT